MPISKKSFALDKVAGQLRKTKGKKTLRAFPQAQPQEEDPRLTNMPALKRLLENLGKETPEPERASLLEKALLTAAPIALGAAFGGARGGEIGAKAGLIGLGEVQRTEKEAEARVEKKQMKKLQELKSAVDVEQILLEDERNRRKDEIEANERTRKQLRQADIDRIREEGLGVRKQDAARRAANHRMKLRVTAINQLKRGASGSAVTKAFDKLSAATSAKENIRVLLDKQVPQAIKSQAFAGLNAALARLSGEVGVLTEQDVKRYGQSGAWIEKVKQALQNIRGGPTQQNLLGAMKLVNAFDKGAKNFLRQQARVAAKASSRVTGLPVQETTDLINIEEMIASSALPASPSDLSNPDWSPINLDEEIAAAEESIRLGTPIIGTEAGVPQAQAAPRALPPPGDPNEEEELDRFLME